MYIFNNIISEVAGNSGNIHADKPYARTGNTEQIFHIET